MKALFLITMHVIILSEEDIFTFNNALRDSENVENEQLFKQFIENVPEVIPSKRNRYLTYVYSIITVIK